MTDRSHHLRACHHDSNPLLGLHRPTELWGVRDPTDLRPKISGRVDEAWYWYCDRPAPSPGLLRQAFHGLCACAEALHRAIAPAIDPDQRRPIR